MKLELSENEGTKFTIKLFAQIRLLNVIIIINNHETTMIN